MMLWAFGIFGIYFFTSLYLQGILGFSPVEAGLAFVPMALFVAAFAGISGPVVTWIGAQRTVALGLVIMLGGLYLFARQGLHVSYAALMPAFLLFGAGSGLMNAPLTSSVLSSMPSHRSGVASALLNSSREVAGLLGITVIGAVLRSRQCAALRDGLAPARAFLDGYHAGLTVTIALTAAGIIVAMIALRRAGTAPVPAAEPVPAGPTSEQAARLPERHV
jgi:dipeptide/tripeptide permease